MISKVGQIEFRPSQYFIRVTPDVLHYRNGAFEEGSVLNIRAIKRGEEELAVGEKEVLISASADGGTPTTSVSGQMNFGVYSDTVKVTIELKNLEGTKIYDTKSVLVIRDGADGKPGAAGPSYYPAGKYSDNISYTRNATQAPVVELEGMYYGQKKVGTIKGINPKTDVANNGGNWEVADMFEFIFAKVAFIEFGKLASAVFNGNYMFSQYGVTSAGAATDAYQSFDPSLADPTANASFMPNILLDFYNGKAWFNDIVAKGTINADRGYIGNFFIEHGILAAYSSDNKKSLALTSEYIRFTDTMGVQSNDSVVTLGTMSKTGANITRNYLFNLDSASASGVFVNTNDLNFYSLNGTNIFEPIGDNYTKVGGLKLNYVIISQSSYTVKKSDDIITVNFTSNVALSIPGTDWGGKVLFIRRSSGGTITLSGSSQFKAANSNDAKATFTINDGNSRMFIHNGTHWCEYYCE